MKNQREIKKKDPGFYRKLLALLIPMVVQNLMNALVSASDALMVGTLDQNSLSAVSLATQISFVLNLFYAAITIGTTVMVVYFLLNLDEMIKLPAVYRHYKKYQWVNNITREDTTMKNVERRDRQLPYISDAEVMEQQMNARRLTQKLNTIDRSDFDGIAAIVKELFGKSEGAFVNPPFYCDYGFHIEVGKNFFANYNCTILDVAKVKIGDNCQMAPNVAIYTAGHPVHPAARNSAYEYGIEVTIGDNVWIGGNTVILPGVHIGDNVVIGGGSVVTKDIPDWSIAAGNPCKVIRKITEEDKQYYFRDRKFDDEAWEVIKNL